MLTCHYTTIGRRDGKVVEVFTWNDGAHI